MCLSVSVKVYEFNETRYAKKSGIRSGISVWNIGQHHRVIAIWWFEIKFIHKKFEETPLCLLNTVIHSPPDCARNYLYKIRSTKPTLIHGNHRVDRVLSFLSSRLNCDYPTPSHAGAVLPPPLVPGEAHSHTGEGVGGSQFQRGDRHSGTLGISALCDGNHVMAPPRYARHSVYDWTFWCAVHMCVNAKIVDQSPERVAETESMHVRPWKQVIGS